MRISKDGLTFGGGNIAFYDETAVTNKFGADCDNCTETGLYYLPYGTAHSSTGASATLLVIRVNEGNSFSYKQIIFELWGRNIFCRYKDYNQTDWSSWAQFTFETPIS